MSGDDNTLYRINDVLNALATEFRVEDAYATEDEFDAMLNELTHHVASEFRVVVAP